MVVILSLLFSVSLLAIVATGQLIPQFYTNTCPNALNIIRTAVDTAVANEARMGASLLRLHFHDCFVNGCDASILLDATATMESEKTAPPNHNSVRGFDVVEDIKSKLEAVCPQTVSCADILAVAARDSVVALGGPSWDLELGRRDSLTAYKDGTVEIPGPASNASGLATAFAAKGLSLEEMVALSGAHTIGEARCTLFRSRLYNESWDMDPALAESLKLNCPMSGVDDSVSTLDSATPNLFDNYYFKNLVARKGLLHSDQQLFGKGYYSVDAQVILYANDEGIFRGDFSAAMLKMSRLSPLIGSDGQVRLRCNKVELRQPAGPARVCSGGSRSSPLVVCLVFLCLLNYYVVIN